VEACKGSIKESKEESARKREEFLSPKAQESTAATGTTKNSKYRNFNSSDCPSPEEAIKMVEDEHKYYKSMNVNDKPKPVNGYLVRTVKPNDHDDKPTSLELDLDDLALFTFDRSVYFYKWCVYSGSSHKHDHIVVWMRKDANE
jgi:hypothetical protein